MSYAPEVTRVGKPRADARLIVDANGQIREANEAAHRLLGYQAGTLVGLSLAWIMPPSRHALLAELSTAFKEGKPRCLPGVLMRDDGGLLAVLLTTDTCASERGKEQALTFELDDEPTTRSESTFPTTGPERSGTHPSLNTPTVAGPTPGAAERLAAAHSPSPPAPHPRAYGNPAHEARSGAESPSRPTRLSARPPAPAEDAARARSPREPSRRASANKPLNVPDQLAASLELLSWLDMHLQSQGTRESPRDRAIARVVLQEATTLIELCRRTLRDA